MTLIKNLGRHSDPMPLSSDPAAALTALADLHLPALDPAAVDAVLPSARLGADAGGLDAAVEYHLYNTKTARPTQKQGRLNT
jgi:hypothetical protein